MSLYEDLEQQRKEIVKKRRINGLLAGVLILCGIILILLEIMLGIFIIIPGFIVIVLSEMKVSTFKKTFKDIVVKKLLDEELGEYTYLPYQGLPMAEILSVGIYERPDRSHLEDYISSEYNNVKYEMCDATFEEKYYPLFWGLIEGDIPQKHLRARMGRAGFCGIAA